MAMINETAGQSRRPGFSRHKKSRLRIDMTPMVDLGFLLITFFIFTTRLTENKAMDLYMPAEDPVKHPSTLAESRALTLLLGDREAVFYYNGGFENAVKNKAVVKTNYSLYNGIGEVIRKKKGILLPGVTRTTEQGG